MTLKEKFNNALDLDNDKYITYECEEIADEFAIGFADWVLYGNISSFLDTPEELLEIYKKGL